MKEKLTATIALAAVVLCHLPRAGLADQQYGCFTYTTDGSTVTITGYTCSPANRVVIPDKVNGLRVMKVGDFAFKDCTTLTNVSISTNVTTVGVSAFEGCTGLASMSIRKGVRTIGDSAFKGCTELGYLNLPWQVRTVGDFAFADCTSLAAITIGTNVTSIGSNAFSHCSSLVSVTIPDNVTTLGDGVFAYCDSLTDIEVAATHPTCSSLDGVLFNKSRTTLKQYPAGKTGSYTVPNSVTNIEEKAFPGCAGLTSVTLPDKLLIIGPWAFSYCGGLTSIVIPNSVTNVGGSAFSSCGSLADVTIGDHVIKIAYAAFSYCPELTSVTVPGSVTFIGDCVFASCPNLTAIIVDTNNPAYSSLDGVLFDKSQVLLKQYPAGLAGSYTIPEGVGGIGNAAFFDCAMLTGVTIPLGVTYIGNGAFEGCTSLTSVTIPDSVIGMGYEVFSGCSDLTGLYFRGDAPNTEPDVFSGLTGATVFYLPETTGWGTTFGGLPAVEWNPATSLHVLLSPPEALSAGAQWQVQGYPWQASGATLTNLVPGDYTVSFAPVDGWQTPPPQTITITAGNQSVVSGIYQAQTRAATATAVLNSGFLVNANIVDGGWGYTNTPSVYFVGGGGTGAEAKAIVSGGVVVGITILNAGYGYTSPPTIVIPPPWQQPLALHAAPATCLYFSSTAPGTQYQLQAWVAGQWTNVGDPCLASSNTYVTYVEGSADGSSYQLVPLPLPGRATAVALVQNGFVIGITLTGGGSGYLSIPAVRILGGGGSGAQANATISGGSVTAINVINAGYGYTSLPTIEIDPPEVLGLTPVTSPRLLLEARGLVVTLPYQLQVSSNLKDWAGAGPAFTATVDTNAQYFQATASRSFFRMHQTPGD